MKKFLAYLIVFGIFFYSFLIPGAEVNEATYGRVQSDGTRVRTLPSPDEVYVATEEVVVEGYEEVRNVARNAKEGASGLLDRLTPDVAVLSWDEVVNIESPADAFQAAEKLRNNVDETLGTSDKIMDFTGEVGEAFSGGLYGNNLDSFKAEQSDQTEPIQVASVCQNPADCEL